MRFNQATKQPVILDVGDRRLSVPKFTMADVAEWCAAVDAERAEAATRGMDPQRKFNTLNAFDVFPADPHEIARRAKSQAGKIRVCMTCLSRAAYLDDATKASIGRDAAAGILDANPEGLDWLAAQLADIRDQSHPVENPAGTEKVEGNGTDPLPLTGNGGSNA